MIVYDLMWYVILLCIVESIKTQKRSELTVEDAKDKCSKPLSMFLLDKLYDLCILCMD